VSPGSSHGFVVLSFEEPSSSNQLFVRCDLYGYLDDAHLTVQSKYTKWQPRGIPSTPREVNICYQEFERRVRQIAFGHYVFGVNDCRHFAQHVIQAIKE